MRNRLWATTALIGAAMGAPETFAAEKIAIEVGGYYQVAFVVSDEDADTSPVNIVQEGAIEFSGETTLDNGLTAGVAIELEAATDDDQIGEHYVWLEGGWGLLQVGATASAAENMAYGAPSAIAGHGVTSPDFQHITDVANGNTAHALNITDNANKISYFTPRFSGFQLGLSYTPDADPNATPPLTDGYQSAYGFPLDNGSNEEVVSAAINYVAEYDNGVSVAAMGGFDYVADAVGGDDLFDWQLGVEVGVAGFTLGGGYVDRDGEAWSGVVGATYATGPWTIGAGYGYFRDDANADFHRIEAGGTWALGPGVDVSAGVFYYDDEDASENRSIAGALTVAVGF